MHGCARCLTEGSVFAALARHGITETNGCRRQVQAGTYRQELISVVSTLGCLPPFLSRKLLRCLGLPTISNGYSCFGAPKCTRSTLNAPVVIGTLASACHPFHAGSRL